jgi:hypothetical protein
MRPNCHSAFIAFLIVSIISLFACGGGGGGGSTLDPETPNASGSYIYNERNTLTLNIETSRYTEECGPTVGTEIHDVSVQEDVMYWYNDGEVDMTWYQTVNGEGEIQGTWECAYNGITFEIGYFCPNPQKYR